MSDVLSVIVFALFVVGCIGYGVYAAFPVLAPLGRYLRERWNRES